MGSCEIVLKGKFLSMSYIRYKLIDIEIGI